MCLAENKEPNRAYSKSIKKEVTNIAFTGGNAVSDDKCFLKIWQSKIVKL